MAFNQVLLPGGSMATGIVSLARRLNQNDPNISIQCSWTSVSGVSGILVVQVSNDDVPNEGLITNWATLRDDPTPRAIVGGVQGSQMFQFINPVGFLWVRVAYASVSGGGALNVVINGF